MRLLSYKNEKYIKLETSEGIVYANKDNIDFIQAIKTPGITQYKIFIDDMQVSAVESEEQAQDFIENLIKELEK